MTFRSIPLFCQFLCENYTKGPWIIFSHGQFMRELEKYIGAHKTTHGCTLTARYIFLGIPKVVNALLVEGKIKDYATLKTKLVDMNMQFTPEVSQAKLQAQVTGSFKMHMKNHFLDDATSDFDWHRKVDQFSKGSGDSVAKYVAGNGAVLQLTLGDRGDTKTFYLGRHMYSLANHYQETTKWMPVSWKQIRARDSILHTASVCDKDKGVDFWWKVLQNAALQYPPLKGFTNALTTDSVVGVSSLRRTWESAYLAKKAAATSALDLTLQSEPPVCFQQWDKGEQPPAASHLQLVQIPYVREVSSNKWDKSNKLADLSCAGKAEENCLRVQNICDSNGQTYTHTYKSMNMNKKKRPPCSVTPNENDTWRTTT